jgi:hypothetical protein
MTTGSNFNCVVLRSVKVIVRIEIRKLWEAMPGSLFYVATRRPFSKS